MDSRMCRFPKAKALRMWDRIWGFLKSTQCKIILSSSIMLRISITPSRKLRITSRSTIISHRDLPSFLRSRDRLVTIRQLGSSTIPSNLWEAHPEDILGTRIPIEGEVTLILEREQLLLIYERIHTLPHHSWFSNPVWHHECPIEKRYPHWVKREEKHDFTMSMVDWGLLWDWEKLVNTDFSEHREMCPWWSQDNFVVGVLCFLFVVLFIYGR